MNRSPIHDRAEPNVASRDRQIAYLTFSFVMDMASHGIPGLKPQEALLVMAINQANIAALTRDPAARSRHGALAAPAPDDDRRPVSVRAVAASMQIPYETARRNIRRLEAKGVCVSTEAGVVVPTAFMLSEAYFEAARLGHERLYGLYRALTARGLLERLPGANYHESEPPVRAAARIMADYLLRTAEAVVGRAGDLPTALVLIPLLGGAAGSESRQPAPISVAALARRSQIPAETARRHAMQLVEAGVCVSGSAGLALTDATLSSPEWRRLLRDNALATQRMFAGLAERGVVALWDQMAGAAAAPGAA